MAIGMSKLQKIRMAVFAVVVVSMTTLAGCSDPSRSQPLGATQVIELTIDGEPKKFEFETLKVNVNGRDFTMKLALDTQQRVNGLSNMTNEQIGDGMLFAFSRSQQLEFVMRDCLVPIDIVFISPTGKVIETHEMKTEARSTPEGQLRRYPSRHAAIAALEFQAGTIQSLKIEAGQSIALPLERLKARAD